jgi:dihydroneopterin aldolase
MEKIQIAGLGVESYIGVPKIERAHPQRLLIDLDIESDLSKAVSSDDFSETIDYQKIVEKVKRTVASKRFSLIEGLAGAISDAILKDTRIAAVSVRVRKFPSQLRDHVEYVAVEITRP